MRSGPIFLVSLLLLSGCEAEGAKGSQVSPVITSQVAPGADSAAARAPAPATSLKVDEALLRRKYGPAELKFAPCAKRVGGTIQGRACPSGIVAYGPYAAVPPDSEVEISFEIQSPTSIDVWSDMPAQVGKRLLGAISSQTLAAGEKRKIGYRISVPQGESGLETRVWIRGVTPVDFDITDLSVTVR